MSAANKFNNHKLNKYKNYLRSNNINLLSIKYIPLIIEDYGGLHIAFVNFIKKYAKLRAATLNINVSKSISYCFSYINAAINKANAVSILQHHNIYMDTTYDHNNNLLVEDNNNYKRIQFGSGIKHECFY